MVQILKPIMRSKCTNCDDLLQKVTELENKIVRLTIDHSIEIRKLERKTDAVKKKTWRTWEANDYSKKGTKE